MASEAPAWRMDRHDPPSRACTRSGPAAPTHPPSRPAQHRENRAAGKAVGTKEATRTRNRNAHPRDTAGGLDHGRQKPTRYRGLICSITPWGIYFRLDYGWIGYCRAQRSIAPPRVSTCTPTCTGAHAPTCTRVPSGK